MSTVPGLTPEDVAHLRPGQRVRLIYASTDGPSITVEGVLVEERGEWWVGPIIVAWGQGERRMVHPGLVGAQVIVSYP